MGYNPRNMRIATSIHARTESVERREICHNHSLITRVIDKIKIRINASKFVGKQLCKEHSSSNAL